MNERQLINLGVSRGHIQWLKETKVYSKPYNEYCYEAEKLTSFKLVEVNKIVGLGMRGESNSSWWEHFIGEKGNLHRLSNLIVSLNSKGLTQFIHSFQNKDFSQEIVIEYYPDKDIYYTIAGQHRTTMAKVVNAPYILAEVMTMRLNPEKQKEFNVKTSVKEKIELLLEDLDFELKGNKIYWRDSYVIPNFAGSDFDKIYLLNTKDLKELLSSLECFRDELVKVEELYNRMSNYPLLRFKVNLQKKLGIYKPITPCEEKINNLKNKGWKC